MTRPHHPGRLLDCHRLQQLFIGFYKDRHILPQQGMPVKTSFVSLPSLKLKRNGTDKKYIRNKRQRYWAEKQNDNLTPLDVGKISTAAYAGGWLIQQAIIIRQSDWR